MKISNSKKQLAKIISENGGWRDGNYSVQDKDDKKVWFMCALAGRPDGASFWPGVKSRGFPYSKVLPNWHQTILSREEYFHLYPAPDADGWIEWKGGECPVEKGTLVDVRFKDGMEMVGAPAGQTPDHFPRNMTAWARSSAPGAIIAYRLHKQADPEFCESVTRAIPEPDEQVWTNQQTIEQLAADYRNAKDYAQRKLVEANDAKADADARLAKMVAAGKALGLVLSVALSVAPVQKYTGTFYNAELGEAPPYGKNTRDAVCDGCGKRYGEHYGDRCKSGGER